MTYRADDRRNDFHWFLENYHSLYDTYGHKFLAIQNRTILGAYDSMREAIDETSKTHCLGTFSVQECNGKESAYSASIYNLYSY